MSRAEAARTEKTDANALGTMLRRHRESRALTQEGLAEKAGGHFTARTISNIERGRTRPHRHTLQELLHALELPEAERAAVLAAWRGGALPASTPAPPPTVPPPPQTPLIGRGGEMALLERYLAGDGPPLLLVSGEPGIGKTRLLQEAAQRAHAAGLTVLEGGCQRHSGHDPYSPVLEALAGYIEHQSPGRLPALLHGCGWIVRLLPELLDRVRLPLPLGALPPEQERRLMFAAVRRLLANAAGPRGTLLILDDVQWAGPDALDVLAALLAGGGEQPLRILAAYRVTEVRPGDPLSALVADLARQDAVRQVPLGPLPPREADQLLAAWLPEAIGLEGQERQRILDRAEGVPFFLISSAQSLQMPVLPAARPGDLPWNLQQVVRQRVTAMPAPAQDVLGAAAIVGRVAPRALLGVVVAQPEPDLLEGLGTLCAAGLLEEQGAHGYRFAHDVIREVVEADLPSGRRALLHRRVAEALEGQLGGPAVEPLAYHYRRAGDDGKAARYLEEAGDAARSHYAYAAAAEQYRELAHLLGAGPARARAYEKLGDVLHLAGRHDDALPVLEHAIASYQSSRDREGEGRAAAILGRVYFRRGPLQEAIARLSALARRLDPPGAAAEQPASLAPVWEALAHLLFAARQYRECLTAAERASSLARATGDTRTVAMADTVRGLTHVWLGEPEAGLRVLEAAIPLAEETNSLYSLATSMNTLGALQMAQGQFARARASCERGLTVAEQLGDRGWTAQLAGRLGLVLFYLGDWGQARVQLERGAAAARALGPTIFSVFPLAYLAILHLAEGTWEDAARLLDEAATLARGMGYPLRYVQTWQAELERRLGRTDVAMAHLEALRDGSEPEWTYATVLFTTLAATAIDMGDLAGAGGSVERALAEAARMQNWVDGVEAQRVKGTLLARQGQWQEAADALQGALLRAQAMPYPYAEARILHEIGLLLRRRGELQQARVQWEEALAIVRRLGARPDGERVSEDLAALASHLGSGA